MNVLLVIILLIKTKQSLIEKYKNQVYPIVGIMVEKSFEMIIGTLKAGAA